ncbi:hypothetical protein Csp1_09230 [Corynebacterium provencense]|uniref:PI3K/PI4K catalytic domain-containing protein n=1 Tax=Corynebacterium provencense TaxID=1737425 RepID=A0A2Z3YP53_9CORY|nr:SCO1664 family protein [Corynebacterium provencense]AWT25729.1 hypothetical protein Csp1_09230 [Corynebacterium provencense]
MTSPTGDLILEGRLTDASNATFRGRFSGPVSDPGSGHRPDSPGARPPGDPDLDATGTDTGTGTAVVYKPVLGEKPLWDFPDHTLAHREVAAYLVSEATGWNIVPRTWLGEGPFGTGMLQLWQDTDPGQHPVDLVPSGQVPDGWLHILDGVDEEDNDVSVVHEDTTPLRRTAVFDIIVNNADRKGAHVLPVTGGHRFGVDHGLTFHTAPRLRTVLWGWIGRRLTDSETAGVAAVRSGLDSDLGAALTEHLTDAEIRALRTRCDRLLDNPVFPGPSGTMPAVPWPVF